MWKLALFLSLCLIAGEAHSAPAVPLIAAVAGYAIPYAAGLTGLAATLGGFLISTAINQIGGNMLSKKPKAPNFTQEAQGRTEMIRSSVESHKIIYGEARVSGPIVYVKTTGSGKNSVGNAVTGENRFLHIVIPLAGHEVEEISTIYLYDQPLTLDGGGFATSAPYFKDGLSYARVKMHLGSPDQTADPDLINECGLTSEFRLRGIAYIYVRLEWNADVFPTGIPNISAVVKGKKVYDPRTDTTSWSDNAALCIRDYMTADYGFNCAADEINDDYFISAANDCDEEVLLSTGGTQSRFTCNGLIDTAVEPLNNLNSLVTSLTGAVTYVQGKFRLHAGVYSTPVGEITMDMIIGESSAVLRPPRSELFNAVRGSYVDPNKNWQPTDFPPITNPTYEADDGGQRITRDIELPFTSHPEAAQRIAKIVLEKARQGIIVEIPVNHAALKYTVFDVVTLTDPDMGWSSKPFRIMKWTTSAGGAINLTLQEESSASYDWNSGEATTVDPAPDTNLPNPFDVSIPTAVAFNSRAVETVAGDTVYNLVLTWAEHPDMFVREGGAFEIQYKLSADTNWRPSFMVTGDLTEADVVSTSVNTSYDLRIRAKSSLSPGVKSPWVTILNAVAGTSGGVGTTNNWGNWTDSVGPTNDYGDWTSSPGSTDDWGYFT